MKLLSPALSRRTLMAGLGAAALPARAQTRPGTGPRALALIGDRYHNPDYIHVSLDRVFHDLNIPIDYTMDYAGLSAASIKPYQLLLILRDGMIWPGGYSGPDAYNSYEMDLENASDFPAAKSVMWMKEKSGMFQLCCRFILADHRRQHYIFVNTVGLEIARPLGINKGDRRDRHDQSRQQDS